jgi:hypothetical protein
MEFYSAMKKNDILSFASKRMELENIILSEVRQAQKTKNHMFSSYVDFMPRTHGIILLDMDHKLSIMHPGGIVKCRKHKT